MFLDRKSFAKAVNVKLATLRVHIKRKKVFESEGYIDTEFDKNKIYITEQTKGKGLNLSAINERTKDVEKEVVSKKPEIPIVTTSKPKKPKSKNSDNQTVDLFKEKQLADLEKVQKDIELKSIEIEKKQGRLMPIEMVQKILTINIQSILRTFESECENVISIAVERLGGDRSDIADLGDRMRKSLHTSIQNVKQKSGEEIEAVIKEYSVVRSRGERK